MAAGSVVSEGDEAESEVYFAFPRILSEVAPDLPVVLILDTLEEVLLRQEIDVRHLLGRLQDLLDQCPNVRVIVAGRYRLKDRLSGQLTF